MQTKLTVGGDTLDVSYIDEGSGSVLVFLHGWGAPAEIYRALLESLTPHLRVIAPDFPGFGGTTEPSNAYDVKDYADFVTALLEKLGVKSAVLMGHSHGGRVSIELLTRKDSPVCFTKAILMDSAGIVAKKSLKKRIRIRTYKILKGVVTFAPVKKLFPDALPALKKKFGSADYASVSPLLQQSMSKVVNHDLSDRLPQIAVPTLLLWGSEDDATPLWMGKQMEKDIPDAGLVTVSGGGHFCFTSNLPLVVGAIKSFVC